MGAPLKQVCSPSIGRNVKFGRKRSVAPGPHFRLRNYVLKSLPPAPASFDYGAAAQKALKDIYGNDELGDCVIAGGYHVEGVATGNAGDIFVATPDQIVKDYGAIGGYVPGDPSTDQGCDLVTAMNYWTSHGFANGTKLLGWLTVDGTNPTELAQACYLFEHLYFGMELPDAWVNPFPSGDGFTWNVAGAPVPENGHAVMAYGANASGVIIDTWAMRGTLTYSAIAKYAVAKTHGEVHVMLTPDILAKGAIKAPNGFLWNDLVADFNQMGGHAPIPAPIPDQPPEPAPPTPTPTPAPKGVTLAQAQKWVDTAFSKGPRSMTRKGATSVANAGLAASWPKE